MGGFFKSALATVVGIFFTLIIFGIFFFSILISSTSSSTYILKDNTVLCIKLSGQMKDRTNPNPLRKALGLSDVDEISLSDILSSIQKAKENDKVKGIYIYSEYLSASTASLLEIRNELKNFKESGKFIIAYADTYMQGCYFLASVADKVILNPQGNLDLHGLASSRTFYKGLLDKIGVQIQVFKVGTYKSAVEPYMLDKMSPANREQVNSYIQDVWTTITSEISESRNLSANQLNAIADELPVLREARLAVENGLADTLMYRPDVKRYIASIMDADPEHMSYASVENMKSVGFASRNNYRENITVLYAEGSIQSGDGKDEINDRYYVEQLEKLKKDENVKAVVFRVNSPGGSAYASEQIWKAVTDLKAVKPIVVSMGDYAASGGYYISCNASKIIAQPSTLTGSIGIFGMFPNVEGLTNKIGLTFDNVKTNKFSDFGDFTRPMREDEKAILQAYIEKGYDLFTSRCADGRKMTKEAIGKIAEGRVWTGRQALEIGLVDELGGIDLAIEEAAKLANIESYSVVELPGRKDFWEEFIGNLRTEIAVSAIREYLGTDYEILKVIREIKEMKGQDFIQARLPFDFEIK